MAMRCIGWQKGGGSEVLWRARVLCGCKAGCEVLVEYGAGSSEHEDKESRRCRTPILGVAARTRGPEGKVPPQCSWSRFLFFMFCRHTSRAPITAGTVLIQGVCGNFFPSTDDETSWRSWGTHPPPSLPFEKTISAPKFKYIAPKLKYVAPKFKYLTPNSNR